MYGVNMHICRFPARPLIYAADRVRIHQYRTFVIVYTLLVFVIIFLRYSYILACRHNTNTNTSMFCLFAVTTFIVSALVSRENKLDMVHVQNSTLAGGVAIGTICNLLVGAHGAILIGIIAGCISVLGYNYLSVSSQFSLLHTAYTSLLSCYNFICVTMYILLVVFVPDMLLSSLCCKCLLVIAKFCFFIACCNTKTKLCISA